MSEWNISGRNGDRGRSDEWRRGDESRDRPFGQRGEFGPRDEGRSFGRPGDYDRGVEWGSEERRGFGDDRYGDDRYERTGGRSSYGSDFRNQGGYQQSGYGQGSQQQSGYGQGGTAQQRYGGQQGGYGQQGRGGQRERGGGQGQFTGRNEAVQGVADGDADRGMWSIFGLGGDHGRGEHRGRGPKNYTRSDERIREDVNDRLSDDSRIDAREIEIQVAKCEVTLTGTVNSRDDKRLAEDIAEQVSGVKHVQNNLRVQQQSGAQSPTGSMRMGQQAETGQTGGAERGAP